MCDKIASRIVFFCTFYFPFVGAEFVLNYEGKKGVECLPKPWCLHYSFNKRKHWFGYTGHTHNTALADIYFGFLRTRPSHKLYIFKRCNIICIDLSHFKSFTQKTHAQQTIWSKMIITTAAASTASKIGLLSVQIFEHSVAMPWKCWYMGLCLLLTDTIKRFVLHIFDLRSRFGSGCFSLCRISLCLSLWSSVFSAAVNFCLVLIHSNWMESSVERFWLRCKKIAKAGELEWKGQCCF